MPSTYAQTFLGLYRLISSMMARMPSSERPLQVRMRRLYKKLCSFPCHLLVSYTISRSEPQTFISGSPIFFPKRSKWLIRVATTTSQ